MVQHLHDHSTYIALTRSQLGDRSDRPDHLETTFQRS